MVVSVPFPSRTSYDRAARSGGLEPFVRGLCGKCGGRLGPDGWGERRVHHLRLRLAWCRQCDTRFTLLPSFLAPALWYDYFTIVESLTFVARPTFQTPKAAATAWDHQRTDRVEERLPPGPSARTVCRWWARLGASGRPVNFLTVTVAQVIQRVPDHPLPSQVREACTPHQRAASLRGALLVLGQMVASSIGIATKLPALAAGLWIVEALVHCRALGAAPGPGRVIPGPSPRVTQTARPSLPYRAGLPGP